MAVFRIEKTRDYTVMSNHHLRNAGLSLKSKGLLSMMLSLPEDWNYTTRGLAKICKEGTDSSGSALKELERAGYIVRNRLRDSKGKIVDVEYVIYETPHPPDTGQPCEDEPDTACPDNRMKYDFPVVAISLSDYNTIRKMLGYEPITLSEDEFTTQWQSIATNEERDSFLKEHSSILTDAGELTLSEHSFYEEAIGETAYNSYTDVLYVFPDSICENLLPVIRNRYIMTTESISYENARALEQAFSAEYPEITDTGVSYAIRLNTLQVNTTKASNFVLQASMLYAAVVLMVICLTVLSLQQLLDASQYKYRFSVLRKLGVEDTHIGKLVLKQLGIWFGLPIVVAIIVSTMVIIYFIQTISAEISAYIGFGALMTQIGMTVSILALLLICYFISTWLLFKKSIK